MFDRFPTTAAVLAIVLGLVSTAAPAWAQVPPCSADLNADGTVNGLDLGLLLGQWGPYAPCPPFRSADFDQNCTVNGIDLGVLLGAWGSSCGALALDLAGNSLTGYPFFQYVKAVNQGAALQLAIDPSRVPSIVGKTCRLYVVSKKTPVQWAGDPTLADITAGGFQVQTFAAGTIQANTFTISGGDALSASAGTGVGVGYDVVCDCNQNGMLDGPDYIDGLSDEAGVYIVHDTALAGPYAVAKLPSYAVTGVTAGQTFENAFYPSNIGSLGQLPMLIVSHGNGHNYQWYDHIGNHMASYGYVVMSHQNNTGPGIEQASSTTLEHTDAFIGQIGAIGGGVMSGHLDTHHITWIGHSRGGEGVVRAYDRLVDGAFMPANYAVADIVLVISICPTDFLGMGSSDPHAQNYHLFYTGADGDVSGSPAAGSSKPFAIYERGVGDKAVTYLHGAGHGDFHNGSGGAVASGPDLIGRPATHKVLLGYLLPLAKHYVEANVPGRDYLTRLYGNFHPIGVPANVIVANEFRNKLSAGNAVVDDYQAQVSTATSSSGGAVTFSVANLVEGVMIDTDGSFDFAAGVPFNGMTRAKNASDTPRCVVFDWNTAGTVNYELQVPAAMSDVSGKAFLSFRAAQGTRHPETDGWNAPLSFTVTLVDGDGATSSIDFGNFGKLTRTYLRTGFGVGAGWCNEFSTLRIRLTDFLNNGSGLDLANIAAIRFEFGTSAGAPRGRIGVDDIEFTVN